ncbi:MAG: EamA family transporter [Ruminococcaceae bacterium]|nr:EamA family transporter [Oscillospiraceae bacterium]
MKKALLKYIFVLLLFGSNGIIASYIDLSSYEIVFMRTMIGSLSLFVFFLLGRGKFTFTFHKKDFVFISVSGIAMGTGWMLLYEAYTQIGVSVSSLCYYSGPIIVMLLSSLIFKEKLTFVKIIAFASVLVGMLLVNGCERAVTSSFGLLCGLSSAVMYAIMVIFSRKATSVTGLEKSALQLFMAFVTVAAFVGAKEGFMIEISAESILPIIILGLLNTGIGCYLYFSSIEKLPVLTVAICGYLEPLSAVLLSVIFIGETLLPLQIVGIFLIVGGAVFGECVKPKANPSKQ